MLKIFELRNKPELKIILKKDKFEIIDALEINNNGIYSKSEIIKIELNKEKTNWFVTVFGNILEILTGIAFGGKFKNKAKLKLNFENKTIILLLNNNELKEAEKISKLLTIEKT